MKNVIFISFSSFSHTYPFEIAKIIANDLDFYIYCAVTQREMGNLKMLCEKNTCHFPGYNKKYRNDIHYHYNILSSYIPSYIS